MAILENKSDFTGDLIPAQGSDGRIYVVVVVRGTFDIGDTREIVKSDEQDPVCFGDEYFGEEGKSSIRMAADTAIRKPGTDIVMIGSAYAPNQQPVSKMNVTLSVGSLSKNVSVFGDRVWEHTLGKTHISRPKPFEKIPIVYEHAFGGVDARHENPAKHDWEKRNPVGTGFYAKKTG